MLDEAIARGDRAAARAVLADLASVPASAQAGSPPARRRAGAIRLLAMDLPPDQQRVELTIAEFLLGRFSPPPKTTSRPDPSLAANDAAGLATTLRSDGHQDPVIVATFPGFHPNPYGRLMEQAYAASGLAALHVDGVEAIDAIVDGAAAGRYRVVVHLNAPDRFVKDERGLAALDSAADGALSRIDQWAAAGSTLVASIHNGARLTDERAPAERRVAQGIMDRADLIHILSASTPDLLSDWITVDRRRIVHVPHPNYDGVYGPLPPRDAARRVIGLDHAAPNASDGELVVGMIGTLTDRKGGLALVESMQQAPDPLGDGRHLTVLLGGMLLGARSETLIRQALAEPRCITRFGFVPDGELPGLLAALDVAVIPYGHYLNSGWLHLALTYGIPVLAPSDGTAPEIVRPEALLTFEGGDPRSLGAGLVAAGSLATPTARAAARASVADLDARRLSEQFVRAILAILR